MSFTNQLIKLSTTADLIDIVSDTVIYEGYFNPGKYNPLQPVCKIIRRSLTNTVWAREFADGNENFDNVWNDRAALNYSPLI